MSDNTPEAGSPPEGRARRQATSNPSSTAASDSNNNENEVVEPRTSEAADGSDAASDDSAAARKRRRGSRGGRGRNTAARRARAEASASAAGSEQMPADASGDESSSADESPSGSNGADKVAAKPKARRSPRRTATTSASTAEVAADVSLEHDDAGKPRIGDSRPAPADEQDEEGSDSQGPAKRKRRRGGRRRSGAKKPVDVSLDTTADSADELDEEARERRRGKERKGRPVGRYLMCVQKRDKATQIAVMEGRSLIEHYVSRPHDDVSQIDGNIYLSRVQNVLPGMEAAFIDIGTPKNAVLYRGDVRYDTDDLEGAKKQDNRRIEEMIKGGQVIACQVTKNPIGSKGARLTQEVSLPGRFVVLMPNNSTYGISKRLPDDERKRLRKVLDEVKPKEHGIIVRTAAEGATADELRRDVTRLVKQWEEIEAQIFSAHAPALLYREPDMAVRIIREEFSKDYRGVVIDDRKLYEEVRDYVASISPEMADRIEYYDRDVEPLPLFERYHVHEQLHKALDRKVWLPSGGSLIIERTEALTVIDVNTGKNVGKSNLEETVYKNNLEAAEEIAHQLRLRDIGGIIVIDFIDMEIKRNRDEVLNRLRDALSRDKTRTQAYPIGELGLVEMTRKRISEGLVESFSEGCPSCNGRGFVLDESLLTD